MEDRFGWDWKKSNEMDWWLQNYATLDISWCPESDLLRNCPGCHRCCHLRQVGSHAVGIAAGTFEWDMWSNSLVGDSNSLNPTGSLILFFELQEWSVVIFHHQSPHPSGEPDVQAMVGRWVLHLVSHSHPWKNRRWTWILWLTFCWKGGWCTPQV